MTSHLELPSATILEIGIDEAGRGCLAGPVVAAAVCMPSNFDDCCDTPPGPNFREPSPGCWSIWARLYHLEYRQRARGSAGVGGGAVRPRLGTAHSNARQFCS